MSIVDLIPNRPSAAHDGGRRVHSFGSARAGFKALLAQLPNDPRRHVLLPAYIGWSAREGSGVFDPVQETGFPFAFYGVDDNLDIELESLESALRAHETAVVVLIHYFGRPSAVASTAAELARHYGAIVVEDEAHAWLSDLVGGICGRLGDASLFSLHKLLAVPDGGLLVVDPRLDVSDNGDGSGTSMTRALDVLGGDLHEIARRRRSNLAALYDALPELIDDVTPLWRDWPAGAVPQSFPIVVRHHDRDALYHLMNARGVGVVSLYHTLIEPLRLGEFPVPLELSRRIMNLPLHQGLTPSHMREVVGQLGEVLRTAPLRK